MSAKLVGQALTARGLNPTEKLILIALADCTNTGTGRCMPSISWLAAVAEKSERTVQRWLRSLEDRRLIAVIPRAGTSNLFQVFPHGGDAFDTPPGDTHVRGRGVTPLSPTGDTQMSPSGDTQMSPEPEGTRNNRGGDLLAHHYCRVQTRFVDYPKSDCEACSPQPAATAAGGT